MFTILCCADINNEKVNLELVLEELPRSISVLKDAITQIFGSEAQAAGSRPFAIARVNLYDDAHHCWADLVSLEQLREYDQLYVFQPQSQWHRDVQRDLPPPRTPIAGGPIRARTSNTVTAPPLCTSSPHRSDLSEVAQAAVSATHRRTSPHGTTPIVAKIRQQTVEEEALLQQLQRVRRVRNSLEKAAEVEAEMERRRLAEETTVRLQQQESEIWRQRDALRRAEENFQRLLAEKHKIIGDYPLT